MMKKSIIPKRFRKFDGENFERVGLVGRYQVNDWKDTYKTNGYYVRVVKRKTGFPNTRYAIYAKKKSGKSTTQKKVTPKSKPKGKKKTTRK